MTKEIVAIAAAAALLMGGCQIPGLGEEEASQPPAPEPATPSSQQVQQQPLTPTLTLNGQPVRTGAVVRGEASPQAMELAAAELSDGGITVQVAADGGFPDFQFSQAPEETKATLTPIGGEEASFSGTLEELAAFTPAKSGGYTLDLWAVWRGAEGGFSGTAGYRVVLEYQLPMALAIDATDVPQGYCLVLRASNLPEGAEEVTATTDMGFTPTFYRYQGEMVALMPAKYSANTGEYHITLTAGEVSRDFVISVTDGGFDVTVQEFSVDQGVADATVNNQEANIVYEQVTRPLKNLGDPEKYWEGAFQLPIDRQYVVSSSTFGRIRVINGAKSQHAGIDYPAPIGTQVYAPNNGRVLFAGYLQLTGNMICIEHGFGLKSWYYHLSAVDVEEGQMVKTGDPIGKVGDTGFVTGPHLHFTMSVNNVYTNPEQYLAEDILE